MERAGDVQSVGANCATAPGATQPGRGWRGLTQGEGAKKRHNGMARIGTTSMGAGRAAAAPSLAEIGMQVGRVGDWVDVQVSATDPGSYSLTYSASGLPYGVGIDPQTGLLYGYLGGDTGTAQMVTVTAANGLGGEATTTFAWLIAEAVPYWMLDGEFRQGALVGTQANGMLAVLDLGAWEPGDGFTVLVNPGTGGNLTAELDELAYGLWGVSLPETFYYTEAGTYTATVIVSGPGGGYKEVQSEVFATQMESGRELMLSGVQFVVADTSAVAGDFMAVIDWGDGSDEDIVPVSGSGGVFYVTAKEHTYAEDSYDYEYGRYVVVITLTQGEVDVLKTKQYVTVTRPEMGLEVANVVVKADGVVAEQVVATFWTADVGMTSDNFLAIIEWGDGTSRVGAISGANGVFQVIGGHMYDFEGHYPITVTIEQTWQPLARAAVQYGKGTPPPPPKSDLDENIRVPTGRKIDSGVLDATSYTGGLDLFGFDLLPGIILRKETRNFLAASVTMKEVKKNGKVHTEFTIEWSAQVGTTTKIFNIELIDAALKTAPLGSFGPAFSGALRKQDNTLTVKEYQVGLKAGDEKNPPRLTFQIAGQANTIKYREVATYLDMATTFRTYQRLQKEIKANMDADKKVPQETVTQYILAATRLRLQRKVLILLGYRFKDM